MEQRPALAAPTTLYGYPKLVRSVFSTPRNLTQPGDHAILFLILILIMRVLNCSFAPYGYLGFVER
jgi:hypothetical protein